MDASTDTRAESQIRLHRPAWLLAVDWGLPLWLLAAAAAVAASAGEPGWRRIVLGGLLGLSGLALVFLACRRPLGRRFDAQGLKTRTCLGTRTLRAADLTRVTERVGFRNPIGSVRSLSLVASSGQRESIESTEAGYHALRQRLVQQERLDEIEPEKVAPPGRDFEVRPGSVAPSGLALATFFLLSAGAAAGAGAVLSGGWPAVLLGPLAGMAGVLAWAMASSCLEAMVRYAVAGDGLTRIAPWGRAEIAPGDIASAVERWQANGGDRSLVIGLANGKRWKLDSICAGYPELVAWLRSQGVQVRPPDP